MKPVLLFFLIFIYSSLLNSVSHYNVYRMDSILNARIDSVLSVHHKELAKYKLKLDTFERYKIKSEAYDQSFMEYGSWIVGIIMGIIILFGVIYNSTSKQAANTVFQEHFSYYNDMLTTIKKEHDKCKDDIDVLDTMINTTKEASKTKDTIQDQLNDEYERS